MYVQLQILDSDMPYIFLHHECGRRKPISVHAASEEPWTFHRVAPQIRLLTVGPPSYVTMTTSTSQHARWQRVIEQQRCPHRLPLSILIFEPKLLKTSIQAARWFRSPWRYCSWAAGREQLPALSWRASRQQQPSKPRSQRVELKIQISLFRLFLVTCRFWARYFGPGIHELWVYEGAFLESFRAFLANPRLSKGSWTKTELSSQLIELVLLIVVLVVSSET